MKYLSRQRSEVRKDRAQAGTEGIRGHVTGQVDRMIMDYRMQQVTYRKMLSLDVGTYIEYFFTRDEFENVRDIRMKMNMNENGIGLSVYIM
jgi:hypothetical protein